jgi:ribosomal protein S27E
MKESKIRPLELFNQYLKLAEEDAATLSEKSGGFVAVPCPGCGKDDFETAFTKWGFRYVECRKCRSLYVNPRPSEVMLAKHYQTGKSVRFWSTNFFKETADARREAMFRPRAEKLIEMTKRFCPEAPRSVCDVGAGYGIFLDEVRKTGFFERVLAVEPAPELASDCRALGLEVRQERIEEIGSSGQKFGWATSFELLEHLFDVSAFFRAMKDIVHSQGAVYCTTLCITGFDLQVLWDDAKAVHPPNHLNFLSIRGIEALVERCGMKLLDLSTPGKLDFDIVRNRLIENPEIQVPRFVRTLLESEMEVQERFQKFLAESRLSSHVQIVARPL